MDFEFELEMDSSLKWPKYLTLLIQFKAQLSMNSSPVTLNSVLVNSG